MPEIKVGNKIIGDNLKTFTVAEAGANHDGSLTNAFKLIDAAVDGLADSIKFQTYKAEKLCTRTAPKYWKDDSEDETQFDVFKKLDTLSNLDWKEIFEYASRKNIICFSTPFDESSADMLYSYGSPAFKIASADITHLPLIKHVAKKKLPIFISTGMANDSEIKEAVDTIENQGNNEIIIMHCVTSYPTKPEDANLINIKKLKDEYSNYIIGFSDHTLGTTIALCSVFYGAKVIEKHFTYDKSLQKSPDHRLSLDVEDFKKLTNELRLAEISRVKEINKISCEKEALQYARRSIVSKVMIPKGSKITKEMLDIKRPGTGIYPKFLDKVIGSVAINDINEDIPIEWFQIRVDEK